MAVALAVALAVEVPLPVALPVPMALPVLQLEGWGGVGVEESEPPPWGGEGVADALPVLEPSDPRGEAEEEGEGEEEEVRDALPLPDSVAMVCGEEEGREVGTGGGGLQNPSSG